LRMSISVFSNNLDRYADKYIFPAIIFFATSLFLVVKSSMTLAVFVLAIFSLLRIVVKRDEVFRNRGVTFWLFTLALVAPFISEISSQIIRQSMVLSSLDGPSRGLLVAVIFFYLTSIERTRLMLALRWGSLFGVFSAFSSIVLFPSQYWGERAATYFVDPNTLPCFTTMLFGIFLFSASNKSVRNSEWLLRGLAMVATFFVCIESGSRSSWLALVVLMFVFSLYVTWGSPARSLLAIASLFTSLWLIYNLFPLVETRVDKAFIATFGTLAPKFFNLDDPGTLKYVIEKTSTGHRFILFLVDLELLKLNPIFGTPDGVLPTLEILRDRVPFLTEQIYEIKKLAGSHSEFTAQLVKKGVVFGGVTLSALFLYPIGLAINKLRQGDRRVRPYSWVFLGGAVPIVVSALTIQVFNLKMTVSFYVLFCAIFFSLLVPQRAAASR
jgi:hypothetical protein